MNKNCKFKTFIYKDLTLVKFHNRRVLLKHFEDNKLGEGPGFVLQFQRYDKEPISEKPTCRESRNRGITKTTMRLSHEAIIGLYLSIKSEVYKNPELMEVFKKANLSY